MVPGRYCPRSHHGEPARHTAPTPVTTPIHIPLTARAVVPEHVLVQEIEGHSALLHLGSERYFGLDDVGTRVWDAIAATPTIGDAVDRLLDLYDVPAERLRADVTALLAQLAEHGLVEIHPS